ncbi:MAG TPA: class I SAM-dependent methyltransferase [Desulfocapsa sulfexigens]|nr:class I SAM-dependent methyltransferase [Desulfocapsa sulfexigens]
MQTSDEYQKTAAIYDLLFSGALKPIRHNIKTFLRHSKAKAVLDLCCGTGEQLRILDGNDMLLTGVDLSQAMLARARQVSPESIHYLEADASNLPLPDSEYDGIIICLALHEKPTRQHEAIFKEACRLVKPEGHIVIADYSIPPPGFKSIVPGKILIPIIERLAGLNHYTSYKYWIKHGGIRGFLEREHSGKVTLIAPHFKGCINIVTLSNIKKK